MKTVSIVFVLFTALAAPAAAWEIDAANRPQVTFPSPNGGIVHQSPYPQNNRAAEVWKNDACWRDCKTTCTYKMDYCQRAADSNADTCRPYLDACDRACHRSCRAWWQGPLLGFMDF